MDWPTSDPMRAPISCSSSATGCRKLVSDWHRMECSSTACAKEGVLPYKSQLSSEKQNLR